MLKLNQTVHLELNIQSENVDVNDLIELNRKINKAITPKLFYQQFEEIQRFELDKVLGKRWLPQQSRAAPWECPRCRSKYGFSKRGKRERYLKTSIGKLKIPLLQITCHDCGKTFSPFIRIFRIPYRKSLSRELEQKIIKNVIELSYNKSSINIDDLLGISVSKQTIHRVVQRYGTESEILRTDEPIKQLQVDSTKVNAKDNERGINAHIALSIGTRTKKGKRTYVSKELVEIEVNEQPRRIKKLLKKHPVELLIVDGHSGLESFIKKQNLNINVQRCLWHLPRTLSHSLYLDGLPLNQRKFWAKSFMPIIYDDIDLEQRIKKYDDFSITLNQQGFYHAYQYIINAKIESFTYFKIPVEKREDKTTSIVERQMREIKRRFKNGSRWSKHGIENLIKLKLIYLFSKNSWDYLWKLKPNPIKNHSFILC